MHRGEGILKGGEIYSGGSSMGYNDSYIAGTITCIRVLAPAKVNLYLGVHEVVGESAASPTAPSKHRVDTIMHTLALADTLTLSVLSGEGLSPALSGPLSLSCSPSLDISPDENLAYRAVTTLAEKLGRPYLGHVPGQHVHIAIEKHIPAEAGLGGGSSDAAAAIVACAHLWGIDSLGDICLSIAQGLGADVPFFLYGGAAHFEGHGDHLAERLQPVDCPVVIVKPSRGAPTKDVYHAFDETPVGPTAMESLLNAFTPLDIPDDERRRCARIALTLANNLAPASEHILPELRDIRVWLSGQPGSMGTLLAGSGSSTFALMGTKDAALQVVQAAQGRGLLGIATSLAPLGAHII
jgi:4-diphosphocytidyl-2-C-methyl-D-erythritol kinase